MRTLMVMLFLAFTILAFTACTGTEEQLQQLVENEAIVPIESAPQPPAVIPSDLPVTSTVVSETPVVPPLVSDPPVEEPVVEPDPPPAPYYAPNTVYIKLSAGASSEAQARGIAQRYTTKSTTVKSGFTGYHNTVQEGGIFRVRIDMEGQSLGGVEIIDGGCTLFMHDNHGHNTTYEDVLNSQTFATTHDNQDDEGRTASVSILSCNLPDLDREGIRYEIDRNNGNNNVVVQITTAGPLDGGIDDGTYILTLANLGIQGGQHYFNFVIDNAPPAEVNFRWKWKIVYHDVPDGTSPPEGYIDLFTYTDGDWEWNNANVKSSRRFGNPREGDEGERIYTQWWTMRWWPTNVERTLTITLTRFEKHPLLAYGEDCGNGDPICYYTPPGGTYLIGEPRTLTITVPADVEQ